MCSSAFASSSGSAAGGYAVLGAQAGAAVAGAVGDVMAASGKRYALKAQARIAELNAQSGDEAARAVRAKGNFEETKSRLAYAQLKSKQRAAMGANNVDLSQGSALEAQVTTDYLSEVDAENIQRSAVYEARGYQTFATGQRMGATMAKAEASGISPFMTGVTSLVTGAGKVATSWYALNKLGAFDKPGGATAPSKTGTGFTDVTYGSHGGDPIGWGDFGRGPLDAKRGYGKKYGSGSADLWTVF